MEFTDPSWLSALKWYTVKWFTYYPWIIEIAAIDVFADILISVSPLAALVSIQTEYHIYFTGSYRWCVR